MSEVVHLIVILLNCNLGHGTTFVGDVSQVMLELADSAHLRPLTEEPLYEGVDCAKHEPENTDPVRNLQ